MVKFQNRYEVLFQNMAQGAFFQDRSGALIEVNSAALKMFGLTRDQFLGRTSLHPDWQVIKEDGSELLPEQHPSMVALATGKEVLDFIAGVYNPLHKGFTWMNINAIPMFRKGDEKPYRSFVTLRDITEEKRAEAALRESEELLRVTLTNIQDPVFITDDEDQFTFICPNATQVLGFTGDELKTMGNISALIGENLFAAEELDKQGSLTNLERAVTTKAGGKRTFLLTVKKVAIGSGTRLYSMHDITERKQAFQEKKLLEEQLLQAQKMEAIGNLVGGLAHDFNNTLAGITGNLYLAKKGAEELPSVVEKLTKAEKLAYRAGETIQQLLSFTRKGIVQKKPIPIAPFLRDAIKLQQISIPENISLQLEIEDLSLIVNGDANQLEQALMNLIINARDAVTGAENPSISIKLSKFYADNAYLEKHPYVKGRDFAFIGVSDNGCGITEKNLPHIFDPFFTTKEVGRGTGLGLSMAFGAIKSHGGHIEVSSVPAKGTVFELYLPIAERLDAVLPKVPGEEIKLGHREMILLVDDNKMVLEIGKVLLEDLNYKVLTAKDGQEAVSTFKAFKDDIDLVILDVVMPKMGGGEALRIIRQEAPEVKAIFCTGYDKLNAVTEDECISLESVVTKPFRISDFSQKLRSALA